LVALLVRVGVISGRGGNGRGGVASSTGSWRAENDYLPPRYWLFSVRNAIMPGWEDEGVMDAPLS